MKEYLKMGDAFPDGVYVCTEEWMNGWFEVRHAGGTSIDESCDGGYSERDANYIAHAINSHDELVAEVERLRVQLQYAFMAGWEEGVNGMECNEAEIASVEIANKFSMA